MLCKTSTSSLSHDFKLYRIWAISALGIGLALTHWCSLGSLPAIAQSEVAGQRTQAATSKSRVGDTSALTVNEVAPESAKVASQFDERVHALREHMKKMRDVAIQFHLSEGPGQTKPIQRQWLEMLDNGRKLHQEMVDAALAEYQREPDRASSTAQLLFGIAAQNADHDRFDGMLDIVLELEKRGFSAPQFSLCFGLTAAAHNQFETAKPHIEIARKKLDQGMIELGRDKTMTDEQRQAMGKKLFDVFSLLTELSNVEQLDPLWEEEQKFRAEDQQGTPLPRVLIQTTKGELIVELFENQAPNTVANFISLCEKGFYDGLPFHRVITHFMAQGGCPNRDGTGDPGYSIRTELSAPHRKFFRGTLGMAMSGAPDSAGSQFFVCYLPRTYLNGKFVAFGRVVEGMNVLSDITHINPDEEENKEEKLEGPDEIISTKILRKREHAYVPEKIPTVH